MSPPPPLPVNIGARFSSQLRFVDVLGTVRNLGSETHMLYVLETVTLAVKMSSSNVDIDAYNFRLILNSSETGIYWDKNRERRCDPNTTKATATEFRPFSASADLRSARATFPIIRCGLGAISNSGVQVEAQLISDTSQVSSITGVSQVKQGPHRSYTTIHYEVDLDTLSGTPPSYTTSDYFSRYVAIEGAHSGAVSSARKHRAHNDGRHQHS